MDIVYLYRQTQTSDFELRYSLRSVEQHAPYIRKIWIFGDKPEFIADNLALIEHVPHLYTSRVLNVKTPVRNFFLLTFLSSLIPDLDFEYLRFSDDYFLLKDYPIEEARKNRYKEDLSKMDSRGTGLWKESLWRTYDLLTRMGYPGYNFEIHAPIYLTRKRVFEAFCDFQDYVTEDRAYGMMGATAILNHAHKHDSLKLVCIEEEKSHCAFWDNPPSYEEVIAESQNKTFFNFNDGAMGEAIKRFLEERFPSPSRFERTGATQFLQFQNYYSR